MSERIGAGILGHLKYGAVVRSLLSVQSLTSQLLLDSMNEISCRFSRKLGRGGGFVTPDCHLRHPLDGKAMPVLRDCPLALIDLISSSSSTWLPRAWHDAKH